MIQSEKTLTVIYFFFLFMDYFQNHIFKNWE